LLKLFFGELAIAILIHAGKGLVAHDGRGTAFWATHAFRTTPAFAFWATCSLWTVCAFWAAAPFTFWAAHAFRRSATPFTFWWAAEAFAFWAATAFTFWWAAHAFRGSARAARSFASHACPHAFGDFFDFDFIDEAVAIGVDAAKGFFEFGGAGFDEFFFADFAITIGIGAFEHFSGVAAAFGSAGWAWAFAVLGEAGGGDERAAEQGAEERMGFPFHDGGWGQLDLASTGGGCLTALPRTETSPRTIGCAGDENLTADRRARCYLLRTSSKLSS
jgi:hypothetical protein